MPVEFHNHLPHRGLQGYKRWLPVLVWDRHDNSVFIFSERGSQLFPVCWLCQELMFRHNACMHAMERDELLSSEDASTPDSLDLLLSDPAEEPGDGVHDENRLPGQQVQPGFSPLQEHGFHF